MSILLLTVYRGHVRPFLHLSLNLLSVHPSLHLTFLVAPSVSPPITLELASPGLAHIHTPNSAGNEAIIDRLQIINVTSQTIVMPEIWRPTTMAEEADDYAELFPDFLKPLLNGDKEINGSPHKFHNTIPSLLIFDVMISPISKYFEADYGSVVPRFRTRRRLGSL